MSLTNDLQAVSDQFRASASAEIREIIEAGMAATAESIAPLAVGDLVSDFTLPSADGTSIQLSELLKKGPVVVNFYRGGWCPFCNLELRALQGILPDITAAGATLVAISPEAPDNSLSTRETQELDFHVLSDIASTVSESFGLSFTLDPATKGVYDGFGIDLPTINGQGTWEITVPGTYVIDQTGAVTYAYVNTDYRERADPAEILAALDAIEPAQGEVTRAIKDLIAAGTTFDIDALDRIYHDDMEVITVNEAGEVTVANKAAFKGLFEAKRAAGADPLNTWAQFNHVEANGDTAHVLVTRTVNLGDEDQRLILSIDLRHEDGRWQVVREVIFARPDDAEG